MSIEPGTLYVVATPIGNLQDMSERALRVLREVDIIAAEDTRHTQRLLSHFQIRTQMLALHAHNERRASGALLARLDAGASVALVCDAGTPLFSDPGYHLVKRAAEAGRRVSPIPGPCSLVAALSVAGLPASRVLFVGFLPASGTQRRRSIEDMKSLRHTLVLFEAPHRVLGCLADLVSICGEDRQVVVAKELTKSHERLLRGCLREVLVTLSNDATLLKGEFVILLQGAPDPDRDALPPDAVRVLTLLLSELPVSRAAALAARITGCSRQQLYRHALREADADGAVDD